MVNSLPDEPAAVRNDLFDARSDVLLFDSQSRLQVDQKRSWPLCTSIRALISSNIYRFACSASNSSAKQLELFMLIAWFLPLDTRIMLRKRAKPVSTTKLPERHVLAGMDKARVCTLVSTFKVDDIVVIFSKSYLQAVNVLMTGLVAQSAVP